MSSRTVSGFVRTTATRLRVRPDPILSRRLAVFTPCRTDADDPLPQLAGAALAAETGRPTPLAGVPWAADMRHVAARGIPCVMVGTTGIERAHAVDEWVDCDELVTLARAIARLLVAREASAAR